MCVYNVEMSLVANEIRTISQTQIQKVITEIKKKKKRGFKEKKHKNSVLCPPVNSHFFKM